MTTVKEPVMTRTDYNRFQKFKVLRHSDRIESIIGGHIPAPVEWVIYPSNICGYQCSHCIMALEQKDHRKLLSKEAMFRIANDAKTYKIKCVIFSGGGDPLLNRWTLDAAKMCKEEGIHVGINNQGYLLDDATPFDFVRYSVDAANAKTYQKIHHVPNNDGWEKVNENIKRHAHLRKQGHKIEMGLAFLITPNNFHETYEFCEWASKYHPDFIHIRPAFLDSDYLDEKYPGGGKELKDHIIPELKNVAKRIESDFPNAFFRIDKFEGYWTEKLYSKCRANSLIAVTSGDGAFLVCQDRGISSTENYLRWGDYNTQSFQQIWWSPEHKQVMEAIDLKNCPRCVENSMNEIIEHGFINDVMKMDLI
jgi:MoaA/NifB/PqqE/SkfB family radical SAM enzyme